MFNYRHIPVSAIVKNNYYSTVDVFNYNRKKQSYITIESVLDT